MRIVEPSRPLVVEIGQGAFLQDRGGLRADRDDAVGKPRHHLRHLLDEIGRVAPGLAQFIEPRAALAIAIARGSSAYSVAGRFGVSPSGKGKVSKVVEGVYRGSFPTPSHVHSPSAQAS